VLRAAVFAAVCVLFAVQGHVMTSGVEVPWWALVAGVVVSGGTAWALAGRERGLLAVGSVAVAAQAALHASFSLAQAIVRPESADGASLTQRWVAYLLCSPSGTDTYAGVAAMSTHTMSHDMAGSSSMDSSGSTTSMSGMDGMGSVGHAGHVMEGMSPTGMLVAHMVAALLCGLWLAHGERAAFRR
jgi:hypothetical protein